MVKKNAYNTQIKVKPFLKIILKKIARCFYFAWIRCFHPLLCPWLSLTRTHFCIKEREKIHENALMKSSAKDDKQPKTCDTDELENNIAKRSAYVSVYQYQYISRIIS